MVLNSTNEHVSRFPQKWWQHQNQLTNSHKIICLDTMCVIFWCQTSVLKSFLIRFPLKNSRNCTHIYVSISNCFPPIPIVVKESIYNKDKSLNIKVCSFLIRGNSREPCRLRLTGPKDITIIVTIMTCYCLIFRTLVHIHALKYLRISD